MCQHHVIIIDDKDFEALLKLWEWIKNLFKRQQK